MKKSRKPIRKSVKPEKIVKTDTKPKGVKPFENNFSIISLGCPKNLIDSETMLGRIEALGYQFEPEAGRLKIVLLNTCGFLESAREEAAEVIMQLQSLKRKNKIERIIVSGCMVQNATKSQLRKFPGVDAWLGVRDENRIAEVIENFSEKPQFVRSELSVLQLDDSLRHPLTEPHVAYLKIADGCNRHCAYCLIPSIRGRFTSKSQTAILEEAKRLSESGVKELILIAQETTKWGSDLEPQAELASLFESLLDQGGFEWIRLMYTYPENFSDRLISFFGKTENGCTILPYIDIPLQHASDPVLKRMNRKTMRTETEELLAKLYENIDSLVLRSSFIVGFPGETDEMFSELCEFVQKWRFERAGVFTFSPEPMTPAFEMDGQVSDITAQWRQKKLYGILESIARERAEKQKGKTLDLIIDRHEFDETGKPIKDLYIARTAADSPENDPIAYVTSEEDILGKIVPCEIIENSGIDLVAVK